MTDINKMVRLAVGLGYKAVISVYDGNKYIEMPQVWTIYSNTLYSRSVSVIEEIITDPEIVFGFSKKSKNYFIIDSYSFDKFKNNLQKRGWATDDFSRNIEKEVGPNETVSLASWRLESDMLFTSEIFYTILQSMLKRAGVSPEEERDLEIIGSLLETKDSEYEDYSPSENIKKDLALLGSMGIKVKPNTSGRFVIEGNYCVEFQSERELKENLNALGGMWITATSTTLMFPNHSTYLAFMLDLLKRNKYSHTNGRVHKNGETHAWTTDDKDLYTHVEEKEVSDLANRIRKFYGIESDEEESGMVSTDAITESVEDDVIVLRSLGYKFEPVSLSNWDYSYPDCWRVKVYSKKILDACAGRIPYLRLLTNKGEFVVDFASENDLRTALDYLGYQIKFVFGDYRIYGKGENESHHYGYCVLKPNSATYLKKEEVAGFAKRIRELGLVDPDEERGILSTDKLLEAKNISEPIANDIRLLKLCGVDVDPSCDAINKVRSLNLWSNKNYSRACELLKSLPNIISIQNSFQISQMKDDEKSGYAIFFPTKQMMLNFIDELEPALDCHYDWETGYILDGYGNNIGFAMIDEEYTHNIPIEELHRLAIEFRKVFGIDPGDDQIGLEITSALAEGNKIKEIFNLVGDKVPEYISFLRAAGYDVQRRKVSGEDMVFVNGQYYIRFGETNPITQKDEDLIFDLYVSINHSQNKIYFASEEDLLDAVKRLNLKVNWDSSFGRTPQMQHYLVKSKNTSLTDITVVSISNIIVFAQKVRERLGISDYDEESGFTSTGQIMEGRSETLKTIEKAVNALRGIGLTVHFDPTKSLIRVEPIITLIARSTGNVENRYLYIQPEGKSFISSHEVDDSQMNYYYLNKEDAISDAEQFESGIETSFDNEESVLFGFDAVIKMANKFAGKEGTTDREGLEAIGSILEYQEHEFHLWQKGLSEIYTGKVRLGWTEDGDPLFMLTGYGAGYIKKEWGHTHDWDRINKLDSSCMQQFKSYIGFESNNGDIYFFFLNASEAKEFAIANNFDFLPNQCCEILDMTVIELFYNKNRELISDDNKGLEAEYRLTEDIKK